MSQILQYPLRFEPTFQYRPWGGRRLGKWLVAPLPGDGSIGEAWLLGDREDCPSVVSNGSLEGRTIAQLMVEFPVQLLGDLAGCFQRFPLLLKLLDVREALSVQVHPSDRHAVYLPAGETGKTKAWVMLDTGAESRLYDWNRVYAATDRRRSLQVDQAMACMDFTKSALETLVSVVEMLRPALREQLLFYEYFGLWRISGGSRFVVGNAGIPRVIVCIDGEGEITHSGLNYKLKRGDVFLLSGVWGGCVCQPHGTITLLEISLPEGRGIR